MSVQNSRPGNGRASVPGLFEALRTWIDRYIPSSGSLVLVDECMLTVPIDDVLWQGYIIQSDSGSIPIASSSSFIVATVPLNRRWRLHAVQMSRVSGDNTFNALLVQAPAGYFSVGANVELVAFTAQTTFIWPTNVSGADTGSGAAFCGALLEPGMSLLMRAAGVGTAASVFRLNLYMTISPIVRKSPF